ncbi:MAG: LysR family transcriptional regulator [Oceanicaulis sp.]
MQQLEYVDAVSRYRSLRAAADSLGVTPQALSRAIGALERELGGEIFERANGGAVFTAFGAQLHGKAMRVLRLRDQIQTTVAADTRGRIAVGIGYFFTMTRLSQLAAAEFETLGYERVDYVQGANVELSPRVASGELDLAFTSAISPGPRLEFRPCLEFGWAIACRRDHPLTTDGDLGRVGDFGFVTAPSPSGHGQLESAVRTLSGKTARIVAVSDSTMQLLRAVQQSDYLAVVPADLATDLLEFFGLTTVSAPDLPKREYGILTCRRPPMGIDLSALSAAAERAIEAFASQRTGL